ncbi:hypothetical protein AB6C94_05775 [Vibrio splendidus]|uniref:hypothetical protein n=1 Tax=Vibrio splendidus TaxID=29497 RepID=UPI000EDB650A|nr:hypothetical protein [Vibrio splendidus]NOI89781.1 hypothetical protein [Vibrio splendidus]RIH72046.1 hypothetical protein BJG01_02935 [Vibrio splendidus]URM15267.1 hypothetical protein KLJ63_07965 [Vibrio splendidus]
MKPIHYLTGFLFIFSLPSHALVHSNAKPGSAEFLISACQEYTELYNKKDDPSFGGFLTTSKEESFRAGYCLGAIMHTNSTCTYSYTQSVYRSAEVIASVNLDRASSEARLLEHAVCR